LLTVASPASGDNPAGPGPAGLPASNEPGWEDPSREAASPDQGTAPAESGWWQGAVSGPETAHGAAWNTAALDPSQSPAQPDAAAEDPVRGTLPHRARVAFRRWRHTRPFWGGLLVAAGGGEILFTEKAPLGVVMHVGMQGLSGYLLPAMMILCGLLLWFAPAQRTFYAVLSVLLALGTWLTSNLGGFLIGMLLGVVGGSLAFGWTPKAGARPTKQQKAKAKSERKHKAAAQS
jgi:hypothetical protein